MTSSDTYEVVPDGSARRLLKEIGIVVSCSGLPEYTRKAKRYMMAHWLWKWTMPMAKLEYEQCSLSRQLEILNRTLDAGNAVLEQNNDD